eukprot:354230-Chlamydomonas_euryale.AAC.4
MLRVWADRSAERRRAERRSHRLSMTIALAAFRPTAARGLCACVTRVALHSRRSRQLTQATHTC